MGMIGEALARLCTRAGYSVKIANSRGPETLADVAERTGAAAATVEDAVKDAQVVVVTIPQKNVPQLGAKQRISQLPKDSIVIDTGNYVRSHSHTLMQGSWHVFLACWHSTNRRRCGCAPTVVIVSFQG